MGFVSGRIHALVNEKLMLLMILMFRATNRIDILLFRVEVQLVRDGVEDKSRDAAEFTVTCKGRNIRAFSYDMICKKQVSQFQQYKLTWPYRKRVRSTVKLDVAEGISFSPEKAAWSSFSLPLLNLIVSHASSQSRLILRMRGSSGRIRDHCTVFRVYASLTEYVLDSEFPFDVVFGRYSLIETYP